VDVTVTGWAWLPKADLTPDQIVNMERMLTVHPQKIGDYPGDEPLPIHLYANESDRFGVPREFFFSNRRATHNIDLQVTEGSKDWWPAEFVGLLRTEQKTALNEVVAMFRAGRMGGIIQAKPGWGKCLGIGTPVLMFDGAIKPVEDIQDGDLLMGPDSRPRRVLSTTRGTGPLYEIVPLRGESWVCNDAHILTLVHSLTGEVQDIEVGEYLKLSKTERHYLKQFAPEQGVDFLSAEPLLLDPYFLGVWFGDGTKGADEGVLRKVAVTKRDEEIKKLCEDVASRYGLHVRVETSGGTRCPTYHLTTGRTGGGRNALLDLLRRVVGDASEVPRQYLTASRSDRRALLAGFLDSDGHLNNGYFDIVQKRRSYAEAVMFLARSLGFRARVSEKIVHGEVYWRMGLSGDFSTLPLRVSRKKAPPRRQKKVPTRTGFDVRFAGTGAYAGFTLDGDGRFLLGDFTVTHNTVVALAIAAELGVPTLVVVHKEFLMDQWTERIEKFLPAAKIGRVQQDTCDFRGKTVVMGMVHSLGGEQPYPEDLWEWPGLVIVDEVHRIGARTWAPVPPRFQAKYRLGFTATPRRKDGADDVFWQHIGPIIFAGKEERLKPVVKRVWTKFKLVKTDRFNPNLAPKALITRFLVKSRYRNDLIAEQLVSALEAGRKILVLSERLQHLQDMESQLRNMWPAVAGDVSIGQYVGGRTKVQLERSAQAKVIFATSQYAAEGLDIPALDTLFLTTPMSDVEQAVGRIQRPHPDKKDPIVVDFRDDSIPMFEAMGRKREKFYTRIA